MLTTIIAVVVVLGGLIFFHELGHFAVARGLGMGVSTFSLGFGPKILKYRKGKTEYALSLVPLGGYVALVGESDPKDIPEGFTEKESFALRPAWQRLLVVAAGPAANIILAWLLCWTLALGWGTPVLLPQVGGVVQNGPADKAGIQPGDTIVSINGAAVANWQAMADAITQSNGKTLAVTLSRPDTAPQADDQTRADEAAQPEQGMIISVELTPERSIRKTIFGEEESAWLIGIRNSGAVRLVQHGFADAAIAGAGQTADMVSLTWQSFVKLAERVVPLDQVGGPIMIMQMVGKQAHEGLAGLLALAALISINLGILNLLPIPVLDGGQIVFCLWEIIFRRPLNARLQDYAMRAGIALLVALMLLATYNDLWRILKNTGWFGSGS
ncbi:Membrane-associated zinc metalloprotease [uncultured Desulfovibrio sp.]|uniref:Zinc metalloprotease n=1 Tax=uncultured Desulfovibrio sp. TaxID=167968 RepID=A0A212JJN1_9BACT|nr:RIP metalloprotease RseP [Desulfovibrio desulfuricans]MCB6541750.1 RIP metalloprotease RseP [Desulfovibrio desulfuricans]MCB6552831.1 RIP metalloprotease RseP [Desulfovibrio desulfuricans]MCB6564547.1 RIP metalloprotease RseP [Desulfovibrio desulfuricans]MCB7345856.1 RIP metalloprotease RseP [Desulfovibrio desulfuricans]MCQ4861645.1 RIP metalloprotease RseP [Desulfovibrio desulfuricans]